MADPVLEVTGLSKTFGVLRATDGVDLTLMPGEIHALIGPNGAGKSTLVQQIAGQVHPDAGTVRLDGHDLTGLSVAARARLGLGRTFQISSVVPSYTTFENLLLAAMGRVAGPWGFLSPVRRSRRLAGAARDMLERFDLSARSAVPAHALSHGERRQLELAMAVALAPRCLLLDEPMAGLGAGGVAPLSDILEGLKADTPMLLIEHDMDAVFRLADRISVLVEGRVIASGSPDDIRADPAARDAYLST